MSENKELATNDMAVAMTAKGYKKACPECGCAELYVAENQVILMECVNGKLVWDRGYPMGMAICCDCGKTDLYSLKVLGVPVKDDKKEPENKTLDMIKKRKRYEH